MRYQDQVLLRDYAVMMLRISAAKVQSVGGKVDIEEKDVRKSEGFRKLRAFYTALSPLKKARFRHFMRSQLQGVRTLQQQAKKSGEDMTLADIEIEVFDGQSGERVPDSPNVQLKQAEEQSE